MDSYFTVEEARKQIEDYDKNYVYHITTEKFGNACREIVRLNKLLKMANDVIEDYQIQLLSGL